MKLLYQKPVRDYLVHNEWQLLTRLFTGVDATEAFEDVGHSDEARELLADMFVGDFDKGSSVRIFQF
jgi:cytochrome b involved in lipid metabolism